MCGWEVRQFFPEVRRLERVLILCVPFWLEGFFILIIIYVCMLCTFKDDTNSMCSYVSDV